AGGTSTPGTKASACSKAAWMKSIPGQGPGGLGGAVPAAGKPSGLAGSTDVASFSADPSQVDSVRMAPDPITPITAPSDPSAAGVWSTLAAVAFPAAESAWGAGIESSGFSLGTGGVALGSATVATRPADAPESSPRAVGGSASASTWVTPEATGNTGSGSARV